MTTVRFPLPLLRRLALGWLLLALVLAPTLGRMHEVLHGHAHAEHEGGHEPSLLALVAPPLGGQQVLDALHALFAGHSHADCQVLDQQTLVGAALAQALPMAQVLPQQRPAGKPALAPGVRWLAPFHARAPPLSA